MNHHIMPNLCLNHITIISSNDSDILEIYQTMSTMDGFNLIKKTQKFIEFNMDVSYKLCYGHNFERNLLSTYPNIWMKNVWYNEEGSGGIITGGRINNCYNEIVEYSWEEPCIDIYIHS